MIRYTCLLLLLLPYAAQSQLPYPTEFIGLLSCGTEKECFENNITATDFYFLGEFDAIEPKHIEAMTDKDSLFMSLCSEEAGTYVYESNFMYTVGIGGRVKTEDRWHYQFCNEYNQATYWTSMDMYADIFIEKAIGMGFTKNTTSAPYPPGYADDYYRYADSLYNYELFIKSYNLGELGYFDGVHFPRFRVRMRREKK